MQMFYSGCAVALHPTLSLWRYQLPSVVTHGFIECCRVVRWSICWRIETGVTPSPPLASRYLFGPRSFTSTISIIMTWCPPLKSFCTRHWVGPSKSASNRAPHLLRPALVSSISEKLNYLKTSKSTICAESRRQLTPPSRRHVCGRRWSFRNVAPTSMGRSLQGNHWLLQ